MNRGVHTRPDAWPNGTDFFDELFHLFWSILLFSNLCCCVTLYTLSGFPPPLLLSPPSLSPPSLFHSGSLLMDHVPLGPSTISGLLLPWNTDRSGSSHPGLCWIIALLCFTISSYLYLCKSSCLYLFITNYLVCPALFQVTMVDRRLCDSDTTWWFLVQHSRLLDPFTLHISCIRLSVNVTCKLWFVALFCTRDIYCTSVCPGRGIPTLWLFLRFLLLFFYPVKRVFVCVCVCNCNHSMDCAKEIGQLENKIKIRK